MISSLIRTQIGYWLRIQTQSFGSGSGKKCRIPAYLKSQYRYLLKNRAVFYTVNFHDNLNLIGIVKPLFLNFDGTDIKHISRKWILIKIMQLGNTACHEVGPRKQYNL
jgi:hypothetical protein